MIVIPSFTYNSGGMQGSSLFVGLLTCPGLEAQMMVAFLHCQGQSFERFFLVLGFFVFF